MKRTLVVLALAAAQVLIAQQPQTQTAPIDAVNAKYVNGAAPGYRPTAGAGLTLNISPGTAFCSGVIVTYSGGTLTMVSGNNYVYLNASAACAPATKTTTFTAADVPIAVVTASSSAITSVTDDRTPFQQGGTSSSGSGSGSSSTSWTDNGILVSTSEDVAGKSFTATDTGHSAVSIVPADTYANIVSSYPCASSIGYHTTVLDSPVTTWGAALTVGGGTHKVGAFCDGTNWTVEAATGSGVGGGCMAPMTFTVSTAASTITFLSIPQTCNNLTVQVFAATANGGPNWINLYYNNDFTSDYSFMYCNVNQTTAVSSGAGTPLICAGSTNTSTPGIMEGGPSNGSASASATGVITIGGYTNVGWNKTASLNGSMIDGSGNIWIMMGSHVWLNTAAITRIDLAVGSGYSFTVGSKVVLSGN